ncbi:MAG: MtrB/PioB family outer membrane beta-barrel protein [Armatimonadetes bacterium]|nr:MtrB/PioB family outer membrane beta-barrel protein [Armatimonadota bacterium]
MKRILRVHPRILGSFGPGFGILRQAQDAVRSNMMGVILALTLALALPCILVAQEPSPMLPAAGDSARIGAFTVELYPVSNDEENQTWVRKYEGQRDGGWSIGNVDLNWYSGGWQAFLDGNDILSGNTYLRTELGYSDNWWLRAFTSAVTRRIPLIPFSPAVEPGEVLIPAVIAPSFEVDRASTGARFSFSPLNTDKVSFVLDALSQDITGEKPLAFRTRRGSVDRPNRTKFETTQPVDQNVADVGAGASFSIGPAALTYRASTQEFDNKVSGPLLTADFNPDEPIINSRFNDTTTHSHVARLSVPLGPRLSLTGNFVSRRRTHNTAGIVLPDSGSQVVPFNVTSDLDTRTASLRYIPVDNLLLTARYWEYDVDRTSPEIVFRGVLQNQSISRNEKEGEIDATYTGIRSTMLRGSYSTRKIKRDERAVHQPPGTHVDPDQEEWEHPPIAEETDWKTFRIGATTYLIPSATLRLNWKKSDIDHPSYHGTPSDIDDLNAGLTWSRGDDFVLFADYHRLDEDNTFIPPPSFLTIASLADPTEYTERREASTGAQFSSKSDTVVVGLYKSLYPRLTWDANYMYDKVDSRAFWVIGIDAAFPPHIGGEGDSTGLPPELVPYEATSKMWYTGLTYVLNSKWSLRGNILSGKTDGVTTTDSLFRLVPPVGPKERDWQPINVRYSRIAIGVSYNWAPRQRLLLELSRNRWNDRIEDIFDGEYDLITLAFQTKI